MHLASLSLPNTPTAPNNLISIMSKASSNFTDVYSQVLFPFVEGYKASKNEKNRAQVVKDARDAVLKNSSLLEDRGVDLPKDLKTVGVFYSILFSTVADSFRPYLSILKLMLRRKEQRMLRILNPSKSSQFTLCKM